MMRLVLNFCYRNGFNAGKRPDWHGDVGHGNDKREARMLGAITNWSTNLVERYLPDLAIAGLKAKDVMGFCLIALIVSGVVYRRGCCRLRGVEEGACRRLGPPGRSLPCPFQRKAVPDRYRVSQSDTWGSPDLKVDALPVLLTVIEYCGR